MFRTIASQPTAALARQLPRRARWVLLLLDGRRTIADLARLTRRSELDVASTLASLLQWGYIEPVQEVKRPPARTLPEKRNKQFQPGRSWWTPLSHREQHYVTS